MRSPLIVFAFPFVAACGTDSDNRPADANVCVFSNGQYTCPGSTQPRPRCEGDMTGVCDTAAPTCITCKDGVAAITCSCQQMTTDSGLSTAWGCIGTGYACR